jgi:Fe-S-cluster containining protein
MRVIQVSSVNPPLHIPAPGTRRAPLIADMRARAERGHHCAACTGVCCTFVANSMRMTPVETSDLRDYLEQEGRWTPELMNDLRETVQRFRLDREEGDGRRALRKTYTCPFYRPGPKGCSISRHHKPYGCLAFNPRSPGIREGGDCASDQALLERIESPEETAENERLRGLWGWPADKLPIPVALLRLP